MTLRHGPWKDERSDTRSKPKPHDSSHVKLASGGCKPAVRRRSVGGVWGGAAKLVRACGGCLGARRLKGVADCDKFRGAVKRALIRKYPS